MNFKTWLRTFLDEKGIDLEQLLTVEGPSGENIIPIECLVQRMETAPTREQVGIKAMIVKIDFANAPVIPYLRHLAQAIAL